MQEPPTEAESNVTRLADGRIHTLIIGAGPSGLATAHKLAEAGIVPLIVEKSQAAGGLMRSLARGDFTFDIGRKELYTRIPEVDRLWREILRDDYRDYPHRVGSLYRGRILELSSRYRGLRRGLPLSWLIGGSLDLMRCWLGSSLSRPQNYQDYWYRRAGRRFARMFAQGYWEKFRGQAYKEMTKIFLEHLPWIPVIQPYEDYGLQKYVEWTPNPNQQFEIRRFAFKFRRA